MKEVNTCVDYLHNDDDDKDDDGHSGDSTFRLLKLNKKVFVNTKLSGLGFWLVWFLGIISLDLELLFTQFFS